MTMCMFLLVAGGLFFFLSMVVRLAVLPSFYYYSIHLRGLVIVDGYLGRWRCLDCVVSLCGILILFEADFAPLVLFQRVYQAANCK
jgi:hypothetical protein